MGVNVKLHLTLRQYTGVREVVEVEGNTVGECLRNLVAMFPAKVPSIFDKKGGHSNIVEVYLNLQSAYPNELVKPVKDGDENHLTMILSGG